MNFFSRGSGSLILITCGNLMRSFVPVITYSVITKGAEFPSFRLSISPSSSISSSATFFLSVIPDVVYILQNWLADINSSTSGRLRYLLSISFCSIHNPSRSLILMRPISFSISFSVANLHLFDCSDLLPTDIHWQATFDCFINMLGNNRKTASASPICLCVINVFAISFMSSLKD